MTAPPPDEGRAPEAERGPDAGADAPVPPMAPELPRWAQRAPRGGNPLTEERLAAYIGAKWERVYRRKLTPFVEDPAFVPTWNWSAALAGLMMPAAWFLYRKLYLPFAIFFLVPGLALAMLTGSSAPASIEEMLKPENQWLVRISIATQFSAALAAGGTANWFLFRRARAAAVFVSAQALPHADEAALMSRIGGVNRMATSLFIAMMLVLTMAKVGA